MHNVKADQRPAQGCETQKVHLAQGEIPGQVLYEPKEKLVSWAKRLWLEKAPVLVKGAVYGVWAGR